jgi:hypothetical protein
MSAIIRRLLLVLMVILERRHIGTSEVRENEVVLIVHRGLKIIHEFIARTNSISLRNPQDVIVHLIVARVLTEIDFEVVGHVRLCDIEVKGSLLYTFPC